MVKVLWRLEIQPLEENGKSFFENQYQIFYIREFFSDFREFRGGALEWKKIKKVENFVI
jgi:hypothetical protein